MYMAFAGANAWNIIVKVVLVGMAVVTIVLAIKIVYDKTSGKKTTKNGSQTAGHRTTKNGSKKKKLMTNIQDQDRASK